MSANKERGWERVQIKAFTSWLNSILTGRNLQVADIQTDLSDGVKLINFLELLSDKKIGQKYDMKPGSRIQAISNLHIALQFLEKQMHVKPTSSAEDFADQNLKMILGFLWTLFKKYKIQTIKHEDKSSEEGLLLWCKKTTEGYKDVSIESYKTSFRDGNAFLALCDKFADNKELLDYDKTEKGDSTATLNSAFDFAEKHLGVPKLLDAAEVVEGSVDERSLVLYISLYFHAFVAQQQKLAMQREKEGIESRLKGLQGNLEERAKAALDLQEDNTRLRQELEELRLQLKAERDAKNELQEKDTYLEEKVEVMKQLLEQETEEKEVLDKELKELKEKLSAKDNELEEERKRSRQLQEQIASLEGQVSDMSNKFKSEAEARKGDQDARDKVAKTELKGLEVLRKNLDEHVDDLNRWMKFLDYDTQSELDFGEIRSNILADVSKQSFDEQLGYLSDKLSKENDELLAMLKQKEIEAKAKKANEKKKKEARQKSDA